MKSYDVVIGGGGPGGSTLAALLALDLGLGSRVAVFEKENFPREHIGESFARIAVPALEESGALEKVLKSDCWVKKFGGYYSWDAKAPSVSFFEHYNYLKDGVHRWSIHVNRAEFDKILLDHAKDCGADVFEGNGVQSLDLKEDYTIVHLEDGQAVKTRFYIEATGRQSSHISSVRKSFLSDYKNVAVWTHVLDGKAAQSIDKEWNLFREKDLSPIGSFANEDGWFWYIPVPRMIDGKRQVTHSLGMVTDPQVLKDKPYRSPDFLLQQAQKVPHLSELVSNAKLVYQDTHIATNYSMMSSRFHDYDNRWYLLGDSAAFVDPLFSSGVGFALGQAHSLASVIKRTLEPKRTEESKRDLWFDHEDCWKAIMWSFALSIDQWYNAISEAHPKSNYWKRRSSKAFEDLRDQSFHSLVDSLVNPDLLHVLSQGSGKLNELSSKGAFVTASGLAEYRLPEEGSVLQLNEGIGIRNGNTVGTYMQTKAMPRYDGDPLPAKYWSDPIKFGKNMPKLFEELPKCYRFFSRETPFENVVTLLESEPKSKVIVEKLLSGEGVVYRREDFDSLALKMFMAGMTRYNMLKIVNRRSQEQNRTNRHSSL